MNSLKNWMKDAANILFDDSKNDLRALPKTVRLQILLVLSFIWTTVFSLYVFSYTTFAFGWAGLFIAHIGLIFAVYMTFKQFHRAEEKSTRASIGRRTYGPLARKRRTPNLPFLPLQITFLTGTVTLAIHWRLFLHGRWKMSCMK